MNFLYEYGVYILYGIAMLAILYAVQQGMWFMCALDDQCSSQYIQMITGQE